MNKRKRHINEFLHTILSDYLSHEEKERLNGPVITKRIEDLI